MSFRHLLRCFLALAEELYLGHAAGRLHMAQSLLLRTIKELEDRFGVRLFRRNRWSHTFLFKQIGEAFVHVEKRHMAVEATGQ
ncbi:MAG: LysR family transcriptional regulator [Proteobacteria bacterium]|nr:LysR family transcriptional regulator [Pseudomonadota bacterium]